MNDTSLQAYAELKAQRKLQPMELRVLSALMWAQRTRDDIAYLTGLRLSSVCGRVNSLIKAGLVEECDTVVSLDTGKRVKLLRWTRQMSEYPMEAVCP